MGKMEVWAIKLGEHWYLTHNQRKLELKTVEHPEDLENVVVCDQQKWTSHQPKKDTIKIYTTKMEVSPMTIEVLTN